MTEPAPPWQRAPRPVRLPRGEVHVWRASLIPPTRELHRLSRTLAPDEKQRAQRFHFAKDRDRFIAARGTLRALLGLYLDQPPEGFEFHYGPRGKPSLIGAASSLQFNVAHSHDLALYALTCDRDVGVDIEHLQSRISGDEIAERFFSSEEVAALRVLPPAQQQEAFFNCWTRKEAYLKANGEGIAFGLDKFTVSLAPGEPAALLSTLLDPAEADRWSICHLDPGPGYAGAVAVSGPIGRLACWQWHGSSGLCGP